MRVRARLRVKLRVKPIRARVRAGENWVRVRTTVRAGEDWVRVYMRIGVRLACTRCCTAEHSSQLEPLRSNPRLGSSAGRVRARIRVKAGIRV